MNSIRVEAEGGAEVPVEALEAFWTYDAALLANDTEVLDRLFAPGPGTLRSDGRRVLVGHAEISRFRAIRHVTPTRRVTRLHARVVAADTVLLVAEVCDPAGASTGIQTQLWRRGPGGWQVTAAHVSAPVRTAPSFDTRVWRVVGDPLVAGTAGGPLTGQTVAVKDLYDVAGQPVGAGVAAWLAEQSPRSRSAAAVVHLLAAGADVVGIARTDQFAYSLAGQNADYGTPVNPAAPDRIPGGSTSGPAVAVTLGQATIGLGTDTAGSIRVPSSYQGLFGLRTTHGAVDKSGLLELAPSFDTVGWVTRAPQLLAQVAEVLIPAAARTKLTVRRVLTVPTLDALAEPDIAAAVGTRAAMLAELTGTQFRHWDLTSETLETWFRAFRTVQTYEAWEIHGPWISQHPGTLGTDVGERFAQAAEVTAAEADRACTVMSRARDVLAELMADTVLVLPAASSPAPPLASQSGAIDAIRGRTLHLTCVAGVGGLPAVSVPASAPGRPPFGICLIGPRGSDVALTELAAQLDEAARPR